MIKNFNTYNAVTQTTNSVSGVVNLDLVDCNDWNVLQAGLQNLSDVEFERGSHWRSGYYSKGTHVVNKLSVATQQVSAYTGVTVGNTFTKSVALTPSVTAITGMNPFEDQYIRIVVPSVSFSIWSESFEDSLRRLDSTLHPSLTSQANHACNDDINLAFKNYSYGIEPDSEGVIRCWAKYWTPWDDTLAFPDKEVHWDITFLVFTQQIFGENF